MSEVIFSTRVQIEVETNKETYCTPIARLQGETREGFAQRVAIRVVEVIEHAAS